MTVGILKALLSPGLEVVSAPSVRGDQADGGFEDILQRSGNWSEEKRPVRSHVRRFDETSLIALSAALSNRAGTIGESRNGQIDGSIGDLTKYSAEAPRSNEPSSVVASVPRGEAGTGSEFLPVKTDAALGIEQVQRLAGTAVDLSNRNPASSSKGLTATRSVAQAAGLMPTRPATMSRHAAAGPESQSLKVDADGSANRSEKLLARLASARSATQPVQVAVHTLETGVRLFVRITNIDIEENTKLRDALTSLLARHGYNTNQIVLNGADKRDD